MTLSLTSISRKFVDFVGGMGGRGVDLGCAYGVATIPALVRGATIIAIDLSATHLRILCDRTPQPVRNRLKTICASFPNEVDLGEGVVDAVLASNILHFLEGDQIETGLGKIRKWLVPGGHLFLVVSSPFGVTHRFADLYFERLYKGAAWPGRFNLDELAPEMRPYLPSMLNVFSIEQLRDLIEKVGFHVISTEYLTLPGLPKDAFVDGREYTGLVAAFT